MSSLHSGLEEAILENVLPDLEAEGFQVFPHPARSLLPAFMRSYAPDAIAIKGDRKIAIEVSSGSSMGEERLPRLSELFSRHPEWELRVLYAPPRRAEMVRPEAPVREAVEAVIDTLPKVLEESGPVPALLTAWSVFEAAARLLLPEKLDQPQTTNRLVEVLASDGCVTPTEAELLRRLGRMRNVAAHGGLGVDLAPEQLEGLIAVIRTLLGQLATGRQLPKA